MVLKNQRGQTLVEYILLLSVAVSLVITFYNSEAFRRLFGKNGAVGRNIKQESEFSYQQAYPRSVRKPGTSNEPPEDLPTIRDINTYPSYKDTADGGTRFFGPREPYQ